MAYEKRVWSETEKETAYPSDFNRIEEGIEVNDLEITNQKNPTIPGTLANKINVLSGIITALTTKTSFLCTAKTGYTIENQDCYTLNGIAYINIDVAKTDGTVFEAQQHGLFISPYFKTYNIPITVIFTDGALVAPMMYNGGLWSDGGCYITMSSATAKKITINCEVKI